MNLSKCTFDQLPHVMQERISILYRKKNPASEYRLTIWNNKNTLYYNDLKESEVKKFVTLIESEKKFLNNRTMESIYNKYGLVVYREICDAHKYLLKKKQKEIAGRVAGEYFPIIEKAMERPSIPLSEPLLEAMSHLADKGRFKYREWSTDQTYIYFMGYLLGAGKLKWEDLLME